MEILTIEQIRKLPNLAKTGNNLNQIQDCKQKIDYYIKLKAEEYKKQKERLEKMEKDLMDAICVREDLYGI